MSASFSEKLKNARTEKHMSQEQLAALLGTSKQVISRYERGDRIPKITVVSKIAEKLGVDFSYFIENKPMPDIPNQDLKFALWGGDAEEITEAQIDEVKKFAQYVKERDKQNG